MKNSGAKLILYPTQIVELSAINPIEPGKQHLSFSNRKVRLRNQPPLFENSLEEPRCFSASSSKKNTPEKNDPLNSRSGSISQFRWHKLCGKINLDLKGIGSHPVTRFPAVFWQTGRQSAPVSTRTGTDGF